jgi:hypothetical protein
MCLRIAHVHQLLRGLHVKYRAHVKPEAESRLEALGVGRKVRLDRS